jgi:hypothetical protein
MEKKYAVHQSLRRIRYFFPLQLIFLHIKKNHLLLFFWFLLFGITTGVFASKFGVPQQFLVPEYRGATGLLSFYTVGFALGGFITAFNLYSYIMHGYRFPFLATLSKPFHKLSLNNFVLPLLFVLTYLFCSAKFQIEKEYIAPTKVALNLMSFITGIISFQTLSYVYFLYTNKDAQHFGKARQRRVKAEESPINSPLHNPLKWLVQRKRTAKWHVETYLSGVNRISLARDSQHYDKHVLERVFSQNHINAARFELALIISFLIIGNRREVEFFVLPAAASALLFFTMLLMLVSALHSWLKGWTLTLFIVILIALNFFYAELKIIRPENRAYGLNYEGQMAVYDLFHLKPSKDQVNRDEEAATRMLESWKNKFEPDSASKPKLVVVCCSGGGSRAAYWTMKSLMTADERTSGALFQHSILITGASGGMLGAAAYRELIWQARFKNENVQPYDERYQDQLSKDLLNPIINAMTVNDWFIRYQQLHDGPYTYTKDRGYAFELQLNKNTDGLLDKRLFDYATPEANAEMPMLVLSPTIVNDGRRLLIAAQPISYLTKSMSFPGAPNPLPEDVEFTRLFADQGAFNLKFTTALRLNATFPYVLPICTMPSQPPLEVMDAGIRDNFGIKTTVQFLYTFRDWINQNTSGVIIVQVRDLPKGVDLEEHKESLFGKFAAPVGSIYGNITKTQDYNNDQMLRYLNASFDRSIELITFQLNQEKDNPISLSFHLTQSERAHIKNAVSDKYFLSELERLEYLLSYRSN